VDLTLIAVVLTGDVLRELADPNLDTKLVDAPVGGYLVVHLLAAVALWWRRAHPYRTALVVAATALLAPGLAVFAASYAVTRYAGRDRRGAAVLAGLVAAWVVGARAWAIDDPVSGLALITAATVLGLYVRARARLVAELRDRADRAERERDLLAERARAEERTRLAADMHDVVTHRLNLMVLQAGALQVTTPDAAARRAATEIRAAGVQALEELRDLVGVLRGGDPPATAPPRAEAGAAASLAGLVAESRAVGLPVDLHESGDRGAVAPTVRRAVYRVVQESLTNVHKHAPGASATVDVQYAAHRVAVDVRNTGPVGGGDPELAGSGGGTGLAGLRQRVEMLGGRLSAEPDRDGGFRVSARLPAYVGTDGAGTRP
jgi:signal transduction histidine kinase